MPDRGLLERSSIAATPAGLTREAWRFSGARWAQLTYEVSQPAALAHLPGDVTRPVPCYARLFVLEASDSPAGPLRLAALFTGGRFKLMAKNVLTDAVVDGPAGAVAAAFGAPFRPGKVVIARDGLTLSATVSDETGLLATLTLPALRAVDPSMLRWDPWLGFVTRGTELRMVEYAPQPEPSEAFLSRCAELETPAALPRTHPWRAFRNLNTISACYEEGTLVLPAPELQQPLS
jgi:hypothetical protein